MNIWPWSRIRELERANSNLNRRLEQWETRLSTELNSIRGHAIVANRGMARLVAKLDPEYNKSELTAERRAESDRIGDEVMKKLLAEYKASNPS